MDTLIQFTTPGIIFILTLVFGVWLSSKGKPYHGILFNIHKLLALGAVILMALRLARTLDHVDPPIFINSLLVAAGICVLALFASGALMSIKKLDYLRLLTVHRIASVGMAIDIVFVIFQYGRNL